MQAPEVLQPILALLFILALILGGAWVARRTGLLKTRSKATAIRVLGSQSLGGRSFISIVEVENARLVVGITPQNISLLHTLETKATLDSTLPDA